MRHGGNSQAGNILIYILIAILLMGMLTVALRGSGDIGQDVDKESANIKASQIIKYSDEVATAVQTILQNGASETDIRFAVPGYTTNLGGYGNITDTPQYQVFSTQGGGATYRLPPMGANDGSRWIFAGNFAMPQIGSEKADLVALLSVNQQTCTAINNQLGITATPTIACGTTIAYIGNFATSPTTVDPAAFTQLPAARVCYACSNIANYYSYGSVLLAR